MDQIIRREITRFFIILKNKDRLLEMTKQFDKLPAKVKKGIAEVHLEPTKADPGKIKLYMNDGNQVIASIDNVCRENAILSKHCFEDELYRGC